jgi:YD repeat-containing protein
LRATVVPAALAVILAAPALADDSRTFQVNVDGKPAGQFVVKVADKDGSIECNVSARVEVRALLGKYRYSLDTTETWKDGKLMALRSTCNDDGTKHDVSLTSDGTTATLTADGKTVKGGGAVWPTTYWKLPPATGAVTLIDSDTGKLIPAKLERVGADKVQVLGKEQEATKYRLTGGVDVTLWYDAGGRLVRETFIESGHRTMFELTEKTDK